MAAGSRIAVLLALSPVVLLTASCALFFPPSLSVSVRPSVLASYNDRPLWQWSVSRAKSVVGVEVALDGGRYLELEPTARSFRAPEPLSPGMHLLTVRIGTGGFGGRSVRKSSAVRVAALPALPVGFPDDAVDLWALELVRLPEVWQAFATGRLPVPRPVMVAVVDTGYLLHPDLDANLDPAAGYDFIKDLTEANDGDGIDPDALDEGAFGHGTAVAGVIAAETNNGQDVAGMDWSTGTRGIITIMPVRALGQEGTDYDLAQSVRYAAGLQNDSGTRPLRPAKIINLSLTDPDVVATVPVVQSALYQATQAGSIVVAAAGNASGPVTAPASSGCTLAVGAIRSDRSRASYSNFGSEIDVVAPGGDSDRRIEVLALRPAQGTSLAAPYVSGALALLASIAPSVTLEQARALLADTAVDLGPSGRDRHYGPGMLDVVALLGAYPPRPGAAVSSLRCGPPGPISRTWCRQRRGGTSQRRPAHPGGALEWPVAPHAAPLPRSCATATGSERSAQVTANTVWCSCSPIRTWSRSRRAWKRTPPWPRSTSTAAIVPP